MVISVGNRRLIVTCLVSVILVCILFIGNTLSLETVQEVDENLNYYSTGNLDIVYQVSDREVVLNNSYPISYEEALQLDPYRITVYNKGNVNYQFSLILEDVTETNKIDYQYINVQVGVNDPVRLDSATDNIIMDDLVVKAGESLDIDIFVWLSDKIPNSEIGKGFYAKVSIDGFAVSDGDSKNSRDLIYNLDSSGANRPILDDSMIPVYYDDESGIWRKADVNNRDAYYKWYDYNQKMWANAVLVKESGSHSREYYLSDEALGQEVLMEDILAFFTWIPRYKYLVTNIARNSDVRSDYKDIQFENGINNTGNVECRYNSKNNDNLSLSDSCYYDGILISEDSDNSNYQDAWYTHPAFTYGNKELTGFWVGKFETTGSKSVPTILPDSVSLRDGTLKEQFDTSRIFHDYGMNSVDAHMEKSLEYGALVYLTHSIYGICDRKDNDVVCNTIYQNNSSNYYTGSGSLDGDKVSKYGTYNYQGYEINNNPDERSVNLNKKSNVIASSTSNIYGVYDLFGGSYERVMGGIKKLDGIEDKYFDLYSSYGNHQSMLGDGTDEYSSSGSMFGSSLDFFLVRGCLYDEKDSVFKYHISDDSSDSRYGFRVVLS